MSCITIASNATLVPRALYAGVKATTMTGEIFIFGTNHRLQEGANNYSQAQIKEARATVLQYCENSNINLLVEEFSSSALEESGIDHTIFWNTANSLNIPYLLIDLDRRERVKLGINDFRFGFSEGDADLTQTLVAELSTGIRERVWLSRIIEKNIWPSLLVCGANHVSTFSSLASKCGIKTNVLHADYEP